MGISDQLTLGAIRVFAAIPDPRTGADPPGVEKFATLLHWLYIGVEFVLVAGILIIGATMAVKHKRHETGEHGSALATALVGCVLAALALPIVTALVG